MSPPDPAGLIPLRRIAVLMGQEFSFARENMVIRFMIWICRCVMAGFQSPKDSS